MFVLSSMRFAGLLLWLWVSLSPTSIGVAQVVGVDQQDDWLIGFKSHPARVIQDTTNKEITLTNGLVRRVFRIEPNFCTVGLEQLTSGQNLLRGVKPEATVEIDGVVFNVGGLVGQPNLAFLLPEWLDKMRADPKSLQFVEFKIGETKKRFEWKQVRHHAPETSWPPPGKHLEVTFRPPENSGKHEDFLISVHYEIYDGIPLISKWITIKNVSEKPIVIDRFSSEILAVVERESRVETRAGVDLLSPDSIHVETDFAFGGFLPDNANRHIVHWREDPDYSTQVNYLKKSPCLLVVEPTEGPAQHVEPGATFQSCRAFELYFDSTDRERRSLSLRKMYRTIAPWVTENPLMHHLRVADFKAVKRAIDEADQVGFEMVILSFGSGFDIENDTPEYIKKWKEVADYAQEKGVELGGYSLLSSRRIGDGNDIVTPDGIRPTHGSCPALTSEWGQAYFQKLYHFFEETGFDLLEHDGPYPGDIDVTERLPLQKGLKDSRWVQARIANDFYRWCRERGIYINAPDYYYLNGTNKCGMGYREVNWSLPRAMQVLHTRQNIFDGTWYKTPSMGWMFVPLSEYHGGGEAATIEPLHQHLTHYRQMLESNLALGVQACFRGPRLFDTDETKQLVVDKVKWFKRYRDVLESDVIHGRRADGRGLDWMLHVNPSLEHKGMLVVFNPTSSSISQSINVGLYYAGLNDKGLVSENGETPRQIELNRDYSASIRVSVPPQGMSWYLITDQ